MTFPNRISMLIAALGLLVVALLSACNEGEKNTSSVTTNDNCGKENYADLIGKGQNDLAVQTFTQPTRILTPNSVMTMDLRPERLNIYLSKDGVIEQITCG